MDERLATRGKFAAMGFSICMPEGVTWEKEPDGICNADWLVASDSLDIEHLASAIARRGVEVILPQ